MIALDAAPAMLAQAERRARRYGVEQLLETLRRQICGSRPSCPASDRVIAPFRTFMHLTGDDERRRALGGRRGLLAPGGQFIFDVFEPSAADIRATHDRWIARREGISERPLWDAEERRLELEVRLPAPHRADDARVAERGRVASALRGGGADGGRRPRGLRRRAAAA